MNIRGEKSLSDALRVFAFVLSVSFGLLSTAPAAEAQGIGLAQCTGSRATTWTPGINNTARPVTVSTRDNFAVCVGLTGGLIGSAASANQITYTAQCGDLLTPIKGIRYPVSWSDGTHSLLTLNAVVENVDGNLISTATGTVDEGKYAGNKAVVVITNVGLAATLQNLCGTPQGVTSANGAITLTILPL